MLVVILVTLGVQCLHQHINILKIWQRNLQSKLKPL